MSNAGTTWDGGDWRFRALLDDDGHPPHRSPVPCDVCRLFDPQRPGESRADYFARITGISRTALEEAS